MGVMFPVGNIVKILEAIEFKQGYFKIPKMKLLLF
jgi:hypothetical protein